MSSHFSEEEFSEKFKVAINRCFEKSSEIQELLEELNQRGFSIKVWMLLGIVLTPLKANHEEISSNCDLELTPEDEAWLQSLKVEFQNRKL